MGNMLPAILALLIYFSAYAVEPSAESDAQALPLLLASILAPSALAHLFAAWQSKRALIVEARAMELENEHPEPRVGIAEAFQARRDFDASSRDRAERASKWLHIASLALYAYLCWEAAFPAWVQATLGVGEGIDLLPGLFPLALVSIGIHTGMMRASISRSMLRVSWLAGFLQSLPMARMAVGMQGMAIMPVVLLSGFGAGLVWLFPDLELLAMSYPTLRLAVMPLVILAVIVPLPLILRVLLRTEELPEGDALRIGFDRIAEQCGIRADRVFIWKTRTSAMVTAFLVGLIKPFRYVFISHALVQKLSQEEVEAAYAHELGHAHHRHMMLLFLFLISFMLLQASLGYWLHPLALNLAGDTFAQGGIPLEVMDGALTLLIVLIYFYPLFGALSRRLERQADEFAVKHAGPAPIASALDRLATITGNRHFKKGWRHYSIAQRMREIQIMGSGVEAPEIRKWSRERRLLVAAITLVGLVAGAALVPAMIEDLRFGPSDYAFNKADALRVSENAEAPSFYALLAADDFVALEVDSMLPASEASPAQLSPEGADPLSPDLQALYEKVLRAGDENAIHRYRSAMDFRLALQAAASETLLAGSTERFEIMRADMLEHQVAGEIRDKILARLSAWQNAALKLRHE